MLAGICKRTDTPGFCRKRPVWARFAVALALSAALFALPGSGTAAPLEMEHAWYGLEKDEIPGNDAVLVITVTPAAGSYIYAPSAAAAAAAGGKDAGRPTRVGLQGPGGITAGGFALFPPPEEKDDPWSGTRARVYSAPFRLGIPLGADELETLRGSSLQLTLLLSGLSCTPVNCTPFSLSLAVPLPPLAILPPVAAEKWWPSLHKGSRETLAREPEGPGEAGGAGRETAAPDHGMRLPRQGLSPLAVRPPSASPLSGRPGGEAGERALSVLPAKPGLPEFTPEYFVPQLEVSSLRKALALGFFAGILLNIMPCVLPVLGLKLSSLMAGCHGADDETRRRTFIRHQLFFVAGIMVWFTALGGLLAGLNLAWGQLFQSQGLVLGLCILLFLLALNLFGVFSLPMLDLSAKGGGGGPQAFSTGFTATLLATPCSGPLLGGVLSWAFLQPPFYLLVTLWSVGLGMSLPYLLMITKPALLTRLPRPGPWMRYLEGGLAFLLLGAALYLATLLPPPALPKVMAALLLAGVAAWLWGQVGGPAASGKTRIAARLLAAALLALAVWLPLGPAREGFAWERYEEAAFTARLGAEPLFVEFTADWCPTCKVMEATTLTDERMAAWQKEYEFTAVRVDLTRETPEGQELLRRMGSASIPLIALFPGKDASAPLVLRDIVTPGQLEEAMERTFGGEQR